MARKCRRRMALYGVLSLAAASAGCVTHDLNVDSGDAMRADDVVPRAVRRMTPPVSPFHIASSIGAKRRHRGEPDENFPDSAEMLADHLKTQPATKRLKPAASLSRMEGVRLAEAETAESDSGGGLRLASNVERGGKRTQVALDALSLPIPPQPDLPETDRANASVGPRHVGQAGTRSRDDGTVAPIDFSIALSMTAGKNPQVAFARERVEESLAQLLAAETLWLPSIRAGANYNKHDGRIQDVAGQVFETSRIGSYGGLGVRGVGAGSPTIPGLSMQFDFADAIYEPKAADSRAKALGCSARATLHDELLESAVAYLDLLDAMQTQAIAGETVSNSDELARLTADFARAGQGTEADANRAATNLAIQRNRLTSADAAVVVASARLAQQLRLDPSVLLAPAEPNVAPVCLVETDQPVKELIAVGLAGRPELSANRHLTNEAIQRLRREKYSVLLPSVLVGMDYGGMGGGFNNQIVNSGERFDFDAAAWWEVRNLGFGEKAARDQAASRVDQARLRTLETMDNITREIVQFHAQVQAARIQMEVAHGAVGSASAAYRRDLQRIREGQGLPIETLQSLLALDAAQREYLRATIEHNKAQFQLQRSLGWPVR